MKKFQVTCTRIMNGYAYVEAENEEEAMEKANDMLVNEEVAFEFGEETTDYAEEISEEAFADSVALLND